MNHKVFLDRVAIWRPKNNDSLSVRYDKPGRAYFKNNVRHLSDKPIIRYAKNYSIGKGKNATKFCLFIMSFEESRKLIESYLDGVAKDIDKSFVQKILMSDDKMDFEWLDEYYKENE